MTHSPPDLLGLLMEQAKDHALVLFDHEGTVTAWLAGAEHTFGYAADEAVGRPLHFLFSPEDRERGVPAHEMEVAAADGRAEDDRWMLRKDGSRFWAAGVLTALRDQAGRVVGFGKTLRDRTDVRAHLEALENRAAALAEADRRKDVFLGTLAHELRNPLAPLSNAADLLGMAGGGEDVAFAAGIIRRQLDALRRLVVDLMDASRVKAGKVTLRLEPIDLNEVLARAVETCRPAAEEREHDLRALPLPTRTAVLGDAARLQQVFVNLLNNAVKYTPDGGGVWLKATVEGAEAVARVEDTGVGIAPDVLPRIFDLFTQEDSSRGRSEGGLGLGLALVKELVALHGGTVQVRSEGKGKGSEFTVRLPLHPGG